MDPTIRPRIAGDGRTVEVVTVARDVSETPPVTALRDGDHPGWASRPARESAAERRYREAFDGCDIDPTDDPVGVVTEAVEHGEIKPVHINEKDMVADSCTKYIKRDTWARHMHYVLNLPGDPPNCNGDTKLNAAKALA